MSLISLKNIHISFGGNAILDGIDLNITKQEKVALVGRNGAGKSTLLKLIQGDISADSGELIRHEDLLISRLIQEVPSQTGLTIDCVIAQGNKPVGASLIDYYQNSSASDYSDLDPEVWEVHQQVMTLCSKFNLHAKNEFDSLSGGNKRRVLLAQALVNQPNLLLLDEPTNHLDIETILWLENFIKNLNTAVVIVSHDRAFINKICHRIIELDRGQCRSFNGNYQYYLQEKEKQIEQEERHNKQFDKVLAQEEKWIRQGIQARRTRNEGRVRALKKLRQERQQRREVIGKAKIHLNNTSEKSGKVVIECKQLSHAFDQKRIIDDFNYRILRGDKVGIIGPNGCGKSTLIQLLIGERTADSGKVKLGTSLNIAYLDQHRSEIREDLSVMDNVSAKSEITINGKSKHIIGYLQDFLFSPSRARASAAKLSGGERNRLLIAKLFATEFNFLILDEPTNDLDFETLELLEQLLVEFEGTLLLVSHDRTFLDNIVSSTIAYDEDNVFREYIGGYADWQRQRIITNSNQKKSQKEPKQPKPKAEKTNHKKQKLSYNLQRELDQLPNKISDLEKRLSELNETILTPGFYQQDSEVITKTNQEIAQATQTLESHYQRWEELENES